MQHQHNVSASGGTDKVTYLASLGYLQQEGILPNSNRQQFNGRTNLDIKLSDRFDLRMNMAYIKNDYQDPTNSYVRGGSDQIIRQLNIIAPWIPYKHEDGTYGTVSDGNPIAWLDLDQTIDRKNQNFTGIVAADYMITEGLKATLQGSYISNTQHFKEFQKDIQYNPSTYHGPNQLDERYYLWNRTNFDALLNYDKQFADAHNLKVLLGWHTEKYNYSENTMVRRGFPNNNLTDLNAGTASTQTNSGYTRALAMISGFGRINYDYKSKYLLEANFRADASSRFAPDSRWGYFPSFSAAWRISEEHFMEGLRNDINDLKIRGSWGLLGNQDALDAARAVRDLNVYSLDPNYANQYTIAGQNSPEIILSVQRIKNLLNEWIVTIPNNLDGGWSSMVPTQNLVDMYEMANGLTTDEPGSGYDPTRPFAERDPRMAMTILYPGQDWVSGYNNITNTLDKELPDGSANSNHPEAANNASKSGLSWSKFVTPIGQYENDFYSTNTRYIVYRYAEVLLTIAEAANELNGPSSEVYDALDEIRSRVGMPDVDRAKYSTKETLRELIRRERSVELAGEGHRRADIVRWKDASGKMVAETVLNGPLNRIVGTVDYNEPDPFRRAIVSGVERIEERQFATHNRYLPIPQGNIDNNPELEQNPGY